MSFAEAIRSVLSKYATFSGRAMRSEYWWWALFALLVSIGASAIDEFVFDIGSRDGEPGLGLLSLLVSLALLIPNLAVAARRLHDIDRSGWWLLIGLVPILGILLLLWWFIQRGTEGPNRFGPPPLRQEARL